MLKWLSHNGNFRPLFGIKLKDNLMLKVLAVRVATAMRTVRRPEESSFRYTALMLLVLGLLGIGISLYLSVEAIEMLSF
jgi:hypothetical protein